MELSNSHVELSSNMEFDLKKKSWNGIYFCCCTDFQISTVNDNMKSITKNGA